MNLKGSVAIDWILSSLIFIGVCIFVVLLFLKYSHYVFLKNEEEDIKAYFVCKERHLLYKPVCNDIYYISLKPLSSQKFSPYHVKYKDLDFYITYLNTSLRYAFKNCSLPVMPSDIVFSKQYINNTYLSFDWKSFDVIYANKRVIHLSPGNCSFKKNQEGFISLEGSPYKYVFLPFSPMLIFFGDFLNVSLYNNSNYFFDGDKDIFINGSGLVYQDNVKKICIEDFPEVCMDASPYISVKIYNYSIPYMILKPYSPYIFLTFGSEYEVCDDEHTIIPESFYYDYNFSCLKDLDIHDAGGYYDFC